MTQRSSGSEVPQDPIGIDGKEVQLPSSSNRRLVRLDYKCSFCNKQQEEVKRLIAGPNKVYICDECVSLCNEIIGDEYDQPGEVVEKIDSIADELRERGKSDEGLEQVLAALSVMRQLVSSHQAFLPPEFPVFLVKAATFASDRFLSGEHVGSSTDGEDHKAEDPTAKADTNANDN